MKTMILLSDFKLIAVFVACVESSMKDFDSLDSQKCESLRRTATELLDDVIMPKVHSLAEHEKYSRKKGF